MAFVAVAGVLFSSLKVNFQTLVQCCKCVANAPSVYRRCGAIKY